MSKKRKDLALIHLEDNSLSAIMEKKVRYADFEIIRRKNRNYGYTALMFEPTWRFFRHYIIKGGFRDGIPGLIFCKTASYYKFITIAKVMESKLDIDKFDEELKG